MIAALILGAIAALCPDAWVVVRTPPGPDLPAVVQIADGFEAGADRCLIQRRTASGVMLTATMREARLDVLAMVPPTVACSAKHPCEVTVGRRATRCDEALRPRVRYSDGPSTVDSARHDEHEAVRPTVPASTRSTATATGYLGAGRADGTYRMLVASIDAEAAPCP